MSDDIDALIQDHESTKAPDGASIFRKFYHPNHDGGRTPVAIIPTTQTDLAAFGFECSEMHLNQRHETLTEIDPNAVTTAGGVPLPDYGKAPAHRKAKDRSRTSSQIHIVR
jgi:hypothetical protein